MLGLLLIYFIGKQFYVLAESFKQNKWLFAILSVVVYYAAGLIFGVVLGVFDVLFEWNINWEDKFGINLLGIPVGLLACWGFYYLLKTRWEKSVTVVRDEIQDIGKPFDSENSV
jgi:hypothetical protein